MKRIQAFLVALALVAFVSPVGPACNTVKKVNWPELAKCGPSVEDIIGSVTRVLFKDANVSKELNDLALNHGTETVICAVDRLRKDWSRPGAAVTPERTTALNNAVDFLREVGTAIEYTE